MLGRTFKLFRFSIFCCLFIAASVQTVHARAPSISVIYNDFLSGEMALLEIKDQEAEQYLVSYISGAASAELPDSLIIRDAQRQDYFSVGAIWRAQECLGRACLPLFGIYGGRSPAI